MGRKNQSVVVRYWTFGSIIFSGAYHETQDLKLLRMETLPCFVIGHHDPKRALPVTAETIQAAHTANVSRGCSHISKAKTELNVPSMIW